MRNVMRAIFIGVALALACAAAHAQPATTQPAHSDSERDARCREAASKYIHPSPNKEHLTVEAEDAYEYQQEKMYLRLCGDSDDALTRRVKESVESHEAAQTLARLLPAARKAGSPESKDPNTYAAIAAAYEFQLVLLYRWNKTVANTAGGAKEFTVAIDRQTDLLIDAYARAVAACGTRADCQPQKDAWMQKLTGLYRSRHGGSDAGLEEFIRGALDRPFPNP
ncbi:MAG TPA: hypothetical protein VLJ61_10555 [Pyrinomonadaceae bacterium]|nr:hypothetical protein [Pyrinomonadaceae bacterium]